MPLLEEIEHRRPGIGAIINELRLAHMSWGAERLAAEAKKLWHERHDTKRESDDGT